MNPNVIREGFYRHIGDKVLVKIYGIRNKNDTYVGTIKNVYPQILTILTDNAIKSISYSELINKEVVITFI